MVFEAAVVLSGQRRLEHRLYLSVGSAASYEAWLIEDHSAIHQNKSIKRESIR
jgi:hypothetical protein